MNFQDIIEELQGLDPANIGSWPLYVRASAIVLAFVAALGAGTYFLVKPQYETLQKVEREEQALRGDFEAKQKKIANLDAYKAQLAEMERSFGAMLRQLPSKTEVANLLNDISQTRVASGLEEELFQPKAESPREFYAEIPNKIIVVGDYHELGTFVSRVAALPRIVTVDDVEIKLQAPGKAKKKKIGGGEATEQLRMEAFVKTYRYLSDEEGQ